ncbi:hypothetical protein EYB26_000512 [Talaromyces marneffei]|uniref:uncharacterized protein n=1 Tax=Talaromyces marneffei TaxID=37727 RepID=UPI0012A9D631|nr:uncharacterized protein EYB26_000512 [Talaromyces marneffei]QGA12867.1 hypothetical protein EYB26_000512 [Talaromyces marneffei]
MQSIDEAGKPRYRAACDACRQSKVRCSGGGVCIRCKKHDYKCRYSIAHRAGKPKGSKNKATLKKLENLQAAQLGKLALGGGTGVVSTSMISRPLTDAEFPQQRKRRNISTHDIRARYELVHPSQLHMRNPSHPMARKYLCADPMFPVYPSPTSPAEPHLWEGGMPSTDIGFYDSLETVYGHASPTLAPYLPSPSEEATTAFSLQSNSPTVARVCHCIDRLDASQRQISTLDPDLTLWRFDPTVELVTASLSSSHIFLSCAACPNMSGGSLWLLISVLDRSFDVLNHLVLHRVSQDNHEAWSDQQQQQYHVIPYNYAFALQDCILEQGITTSYQIVRALRDVIYTEIGISGGVLGDIGMHNNALSSSSSSSSSSGFPSPTSMETPAQEFIHKSDRIHQTRNPECSALKNGKAKSNNALSPNEISFVLQTIHRYDTLIGNMQAILARITTAATAHANPVSWPISMSETATTQCGGGVAPYQQAITMEGFPQQAHLDHARLPSYDMIGLS